MSHREPIALVFLQLQKSVNTHMNGLTSTAERETEMEKIIEESGYSRDELLQYRPEVDSPNKDDRQ